MVLTSHIREASKVTVNSSYFHPAHQHYTDEAHKAETGPSVVIYITLLNSDRLVGCFWSRNIE
jgi:predicted transcriptional regulator